MGSKESVLHFVLQALAAGKEDTATEPHQAPQTVPSGGKLPAAGMALLGKLILEPEHCAEGRETNPILEVT